MAQDTAAPHAASNGTRPTIEVPRKNTGLHGILGIHPGLVAIVLIGILYPLSPVFADDTYVFTVSIGLVLAVACLGLLVVVGWGREISLAQAGLTGAAGYIAGYAARESTEMGVNGWGLPFPVATAVGIASPWPCPRWSPSSRCGSPASTSSC